MKKETTHSLTSDFRANASPEAKAARAEVRTATIRRNKENQQKIGAWHNDKSPNVAFPTRRVT